MHNVDNPTRAADGVANRKLKRASQNDVRIPAAGGGGSCGGGERRQDQGGRLHMVRVSRRCRVCFLRYVHASTLALPHCGCPWAQGVCDCTPAFIIMVCMFAVTDMGFRGYLHACLLSSARTSTHTHTHKLTRARTWHLDWAGVQSPGQLGPICCKSATALPTARTALRPRSGARHMCARRTHARPPPHARHSNMCVHTRARIHTWRWPSFLICVHRKYAHVRTHRHFRRFHSSHGSSLLLAHGSCSDASNTLELDCTDTRAGMVTRMRDPLPCNLMFGTYQLSTDALTTLCWSHVLCHVRCTDAATTPRAALLSVLMDPRLLPVQV